jgi:hypothetical protein
VSILAHYQQQAEQEIRERHKARAYGGSARVMPPTQTEQDRAALLSIVDTERATRTVAEDRLYRVVCQLLSDNPWILIRREQERAELDRRTRGEVRTGDRVLVHAPDDPRLDGQLGTVVTLDFDGRPMVRLDHGWDTGAYGLDPKLLEVL